MKANIKTIYQLRVYLQLQRIVYFQLLLIYIKVLKETLESVTQNLNNGKYEARFKTGSLPGINTVEAGGEASITVPEVYIDYSTNKAITEDYEEAALPQRTETLKSGQEVLFDKDTKQPVKIGSQKALYTVYGVDVTIDTPIDAVLIDNINDKTGYGYSINDLKTTYTIEPNGYSATAAYVDLIEDDIIVNRIPSDKTGAGSATYAEGFQFNLNRKYEVQVVLNPGTGTEIQSDKVELMVAEMKVVNVDEDEIEEVRYSDGSRDKKKYHIELEIGRLFGAIACEDITARISTRQRDGNYAIVPGTDYPGNYVNLVFEESGIISKRCISKNVDISAGDRYSFILTNLSDETLGSVTDDIVPLYGGIGNKFRIELYGSLNGAMVDMPIEPVGVIVLAIDGFRQDVLYPPPGSNSDADASYSDPEGCGENTPCYIEVKETNLAGLSQIMRPESTVKLKDVTSIFPSITLASWASVFTGKMPSEPILNGEGEIIDNEGTRILGNEFFARDTSLSVPVKFNNPSGIITFSSGAFKGFDAFMQPYYRYDFIVPYQLDWEYPITPEDTPQNYIEILKPDTLFENIKEIHGVESYFSEKGGDPVVVANLHYARGAYWLTWDNPWPGGIAEMMDNASWDKFNDYLCGRYMDDIFNEIVGCKEGKRNDIPFSALTVWYLPGLDHEAHGKGMGVYRDYFMNTTDEYIKTVVDTLKELGEFDNKIFIIVSDHGFTAMPTNLAYKDKDWLGFEVDEDAEMSCELKLDFADPKNPNHITSAKKAELANNNLHIWEMGDFLKTVGEVVEQTTGTILANKVLAPEEIARLFIDDSTGNPLANGAVEKIGDASIIAAFNGPMAHIYVRGDDLYWNNAPDLNSVIDLAEIFRVTLQGARGGDSPLTIFPPGVAGMLGYKIGRLNDSVDEILVREGGVYKVYTVDNSSGNPQVVLKDINGHFSDEYVDPVTRINNMNDEERSGDIILIMKDKMSDLVDGRFTTGKACKSWHGSLNRSDSYVPLIVTYPGGDKLEIDKILKDDSVCGDNYSECKGNWKVFDIVREIILEQYE